MAVITQTELEDAALDAQTFEDVANGDENTTVISRLGQPIKTVAKAIGEISAYNDTGAWLTTTVYAIKDLVQEAGVTYICIEAHTAGVFATDLAAGKWGIFQTAIPGVYLSAYADLASAIASIGATETELIVDADDVMTGAVTIPNNVVLRHIKGNTVDTDTYTLTRNGGQPIPASWLNDFDGDVQNLATSDKINLIIDIDVTVSSSVSLLDSFTVEIVPSRLLTVSGTLALSNKIQALDGAQCLDVSGTLNLFGPASDVRSLWFAADPWDSFKAAGTILAGYRGGTIYVDAAVYNADSELSISSEYPVNIIATMFTAQQANSTVLEPGNYITPKTGLGATDAIIEYDGDGGGLIKGLFIVDDNDIDNVTQKDRRTVAFGAGIRLSEWHLSKLEDCYFLYLDASAVETGGCTMSTLSDLWIRRCGGVSKPALYVKDVGGGFSAQSFEIRSCRLEVNFDDSYLHMGSEATKCKVVNIGFEAFSAEPDTNQTFIKNEGEDNQFDDIHLNRNTALKVLDTNSSNQWINIRAHTSGDNGVIHSTGNFFQLTNYLGDANTNATDEILCEGTDAKLTNILTITGGGIRCTGDNATLTNVSTVLLQDATNAAVEIAGKSVICGGVHRDSAATKHVIYCSSGANVVTNNRMEDIPSGKSGIHVPTAGFNTIGSNNIIVPSGATGINTSATSSNNVYGNVTQGGGTDYNLSGSDVETGNI